MPSLQSPAWLPSLASLLFLALLIHLFQRRGRGSLVLASVLLILASTLGFHWIFISLHRFGGMPAPVAASATFLLALYVAGYGLLSGLVLRRFLVPALEHRGQARWLPLSIAGLITLMEWLRGTLFSGFPWLSWGYQQVDGLLSGFAPLLGVYGVVFFTALCAALIAQCRPKGLMATLIIHLVGGAAGTLTFSHPNGSPLQVALVQGAIPQQMKFDPQHLRDSEATHLALGASVAGAPTRTQLIVFPETAFISPWQQLEPRTQAGLQVLADRSQAVVLTGIPTRDEDGWRNSVLAIRPAADAPGLARGSADRYDKHHLVPFGEFIPWGFRWFVQLMNMPLGDFQEGARLQEPLVVADQRLGVNICFEDLFGEEIIRPLAPSRPEASQPTILLNVSNLAWFGDTVALPQHLAVARMRSLETARPTIRATNTGMTAHIDARGVVRDQLPAMQQGILMARVQGTQGSTPYVYWGNWPILLIALAALCLPLSTRWAAKMRR